MAYAERHCVSNFSFLRGASEPRELVHQAHALGYRALAITDECSYAGIVRAYEASKDTGLSLIVGAEFALSEGIKLVALAPTFEAYSEISALISRARRRAEKGSYVIGQADFERHCAQALLIWCPQWPANTTRIAASEIAPWLRDHFPGRAWIALERFVHHRDDERLAHLRRTSTRFGVPLVAAGDVHMHCRERGDLQNVVTCIRHGCTLEQAGARLFDNHKRRLRKLAHLQNLYPQDLLDETLRIAESCTFRMDQLKY